MMSAVLFMLLFGLVCILVYLVPEDKPPYDEDQEDEWLR